MSDLLPPNATQAERALAQTVARISSVSAPQRSVWNAETCPSALLPWLAWAFSVDQWDVSWSEAQKRAAIKAAVNVQRHKGTIGAVRDAITALGVGVQVQEWFSLTTPGAPYTFRLILEASQTSASQAQLQKLLEVVDSAKNLRSHIDTIVPGVTSVATVTMGAFSQAGHEISVAYGGGNFVMDGSTTANGTYNMNGLKFANTADPHLTLNGNWRIDGTQTLNGNRV